MQYSCLLLKAAFGISEGIVKEVGSLHRTKQDTQMWWETENKNWVCNENTHEITARLPLGCPEGKFDFKHNEK